MGWLDLLTIPLSAGINYGLTSALNEQNAALNHKYWNIQNEKMYKQNEQSADNAHQRTIDLYNKLQSPQAMVQQLKEAGLNPALMYSNGGMGGSVNSGAQAQAQAGSGAPTLGLQEFIDPLTAAQIKNIEADTKKKEEETKNTKFDTELKQAIQKNTESQTKLNELNWEFQDQTFWERYNNLYYQATKMQGEAMKAISEGTLSQESYEIQLAQYSIDYIKTGCEIELLQSKKELNEAQKQEALAEARKLTEELLLIASKSTFYEKRALQAEADTILSEELAEKAKADTRLSEELAEKAKADTRLSEEQAEKILRSYSWKYFTKEDVFNTWKNINGSINAVSNIIPITRLSKMVNETITMDAKGQVTRKWERKRPQKN